jgi:hypothetical protein
MFLASRGFIEKVFYCQITDKASKTLRRYHCEEISHPKKIRISILSIEKTKKNENN